MKAINLIRYPIGTDEGTDLKTVRYRMPIGLMLIAENLINVGVETKIFDTALQYVKFKKRNDVKHPFCEYFASILAKSKTPFFGFSTIAGTMPLTIRIIQCLKQIKPDAIIILGGPQASAVGQKLLESFPEIDFVFYGEVEDVLSHFLLDFDKINLSEVPNLIFRENNIVIKNKPGRLPELFKSPNPSIFGYERLPYIPIEVGRGCPFSCTFCSTNDFFSKNYRLKEKNQLKEEIEELLNSAPIKGFDFIHDNFTVNQKKVSEICQHLIKSNHKFIWNCSSDIRCISESLIKLMNSAGCISIFFGIESGSEKIQKTIKKNLPLNQVVQTAIDCSTNNVTASCGFIIGYPEETIDDLKDSINLFIDILSVKNSFPVVSILSPLANTEYHTKYKSQLKLDKIQTKLAFQGQVIRDDEWELIERFPDIFPEFYSFDTILSRIELKWLEEYLSGVSQTCRYLLVALKKLGYCPLETAFEWFNRIGKKRLSQLNLGYYSSIAFRREFTSFYKEKVTESVLDKTQLTLYLELSIPYEVPNILATRTSKTKNSNPEISSNCFVTTSSISIDRMPVYLSSSDRTLPKSSQVETAYLYTFIEKDFKVTEISIELAKILKSCNGTNSIIDIIQNNASLFNSNNDEIITSILNDLKNKEIIHFYDERQIHRERIPSY